MFYKQKISNSDNLKWWLSTTGIKAQLHIKQTFRMSGALPPLIHFTYCHRSNFHDDSLQIIPTFEETDVGQGNSYIMAPRSEVISAQRKISI
jgi:hypothetical protein